MLVVTGCAPEFLSVSEQDWHTVPQAQRDAIDRAHQAEVAQTQAELRAAVAGVAEARRGIVIHPTTRPVAAAPGDDWADAIAADERQKAAARLQIDTAQADWQRARLAWQTARVELFSSQLDVLRAQYEVDRARAVDRNMLGDDTYDGAPLRGQLARIEKRWIAAQNAADTLHDDIARATARLASAKDGYAELVRRGPTAPGADTAMRLSSWDPSVRPHGVLATRWRASAAEPTHYLVKPAVLRIGLRR